MASIHLIFYFCLELRFPVVETNPGPRRPFHGVCRTLFSNARGLYSYLSNLTVASSQCDLLLRSETLVSDRRPISELQFPDLIVLSCCSGTECLGPVGWLHMCEMHMGLNTYKFSHTPETLKTSISQQSHSNLCWRNAPYPAPAQ